VNFNILVLLPSRRYTTNMNSITDSTKLDTVLELLNAVNEKLTNLGERVSQVEARADDQKVEPEKPKKKRNPPKPDSTQTVCSMGYWTAKDGTRRDSNVYLKCSKNKNLYAFLRQELKCKWTLKAGNSWLVPKGETHRVKFEIAKAFPDWTIEDTTDGVVDIEMGSRVSPVDFEGESD